MPRSLKSYATPIISPTATTCAATSNSRRASRALTSTKPPLLWTVTTDKGERHTARFCVMATGCLSAPNHPKFPGMDTFKGATYHTGEWPHEGVDFTGRTVAIIGTGSSSIQSIPLIAEQAKHLTVFQRTANYAIPAHNHALSDAYQREWKANYATHRAKAKTTISGVLFDANNVAALETPA